MLVGMKPTNMNAPHIVQNFTCIITLPGESFPVAFTTAASNKECAARVAHLNRPGCKVWSVVALPKKAPTRFN